MHRDMKGGGLLHGLRGKQVSLILIALVCNTIFIWAWDGSSFLTTFVPAENQLLVPSPDDSLKENVSNADLEGESRTDQADKNANADYITKSPTNAGDGDKIDSSTENKGGENDAEKEGKTSEVVTLSDSSATPYKIIDDLNEITTSAGKNKR